MIDKIKGGDQTIIIVGIVLIVALMTISIIRFEIKTTKSEAMQIQLQEVVLELKTTVENMKQDYLRKDEGILRIKTIQDDVLELKDRLNN